MGRWVTICGLVLGSVLLAGCDAGGDGRAAAGAPDPPLVFVTHTPAPTPAVAFSAGSYVVGQDVALGRYSSGATANACRWVQSDDAGVVLDRNGAVRPTQVLTLSTRGTRLVVAGSACRFVRLS